MLVHNQCEVDDVPSRKEALNHIKNDLGIPKSQSPVSQKMVFLEDGAGNKILRKDGQFMMSRQLTYDVRGLGLKDSQGNIINTVIVQDHSYGHHYPNGVGDQPSHFNVRPETNPRTGHVQGTQEHYIFESNYSFDVK